MREAGKVPVAPRHSGGWEGINGDQKTHFNLICSAYFLGGH